MKYGWQILSLFSFIFLCLSSTALANEDAFDEMGNTITSEEIEITKDLEKENKVVKNIIESNFGREFLIDEVLITIEFSEEKSKIVINYQKENKEVKKLKQLLNESIASTKIKFKEVKYKPSELKDHALEIVDYLEADKSIFSKVAGIDPDTDKNVIFILMNETLDNNIQKEIKDIFPDVKFLKASKKTEFTEEISRYKDYNKLGGGIVLTDLNSGPCTANSVAKKGTNWFLITAGHCLDADGTPVFQDGLSTGVDHAVLTGRNLDVGVVRLFSINAITRYASNYFYEYAENDRDYDNRFTGTSITSQGDGVCKSGIATDVTCGQVVDSYYINTCNLGPNCTVPTKIVTVANYSSAGGDSGSPVYESFANGSRALTGVHSGTGTGEAAGLRIFTDIYEVESEFSTTSSPFDVYTSNTVIEIP